ncbi:MAG: hypothetical protein ACYS8L_11375 [Planctomycetota bacterium]
MTPREAVEIALRGGHGPTVPFTVYENMIPQCRAERDMRNRGLCILKWSVPAYKVHRPNVKVTEQVYWEGERKFVRTVYETPAGTVSTLGEDADFTIWQHEKMFKSPDDYKAIRALIQDECYEENYKEFAKVESEFGGDGIFRTGFGLEPLQALMSRFTPTTAGTSCPRLSGPRFSGNTTYPTTTSPPRCCIGMGSWWAATSTRTAS